MNQEYSQNTNLSEEINFGRFLRFVLLQSKLVLIIVMTGLLVGTLIYLTTSNSYRIESLLQVYSPTQSFNSRKTLSIDLFNSSDTSLDNLIELYTSRSNVLNLIDDLDLNIKIENLVEGEQLKLNFFLPKLKTQYVEKIYFLKIQENDFYVLDDQQKIVIEGKNGNLEENDNLKLLVNFSNINPDKLIKIIYKNPSSLYRKYKNLLQVKAHQSKSSFFVQEGLVNVSLVTSDINEGKKIIDTANQIFIEDSIKAETEKARKMISFIENQIGSLEATLASDKKNLKNFKQENKSLNVNLEVQAIINQIADIEQKTNKIDMELSKAELNFTNDNPLYLSLISQKNAAIIQKNIIERKVENLPLAQQEYIDISRDLKISEELYSELANRKLNYSLIKASTIGNIRVVDEAYNQSYVGPNLSLIFYFSLIAFFLGILVSIFRGIYFIKISNPAELNDSGIKDSIIGVIPKLQDISNAENTAKLNQSFETLILNIETIVSNFHTDNSLTSCKKIIFTSPTAANGKSFVSRNLAENLGEVGHKVLLIDGDLKRGDQHIEYNQKPISLDFLRKLDSESYKNLKVKENLYFLPKVNKLKSTFEYFYGDIFMKKIEEFENFFDYIIIDTAPILSVSDTSLLMTISDYNFLIVRHQINKNHEIKQSMQVIEQIGRSFDGIIYNDYEKPSNYFGYYDLYGDYSYRYYAERYLYEDYYHEDND